MTRGKYRTTGEAQTDNLPFFGSSNKTDRSQLRIVADEKKSVIFIQDNPHKHPFSWFLTHSSGELYLSGRIAKNDFQIKLQGLESGIYHFRTQGEVYEINVA